MGIVDRPEDERPRERLLKLGAAALSEAELLAIFLRTGIAGKSAVEGQGSAGPIWKPSPLVCGTFG